MVVGAVAPGCGGARECQRASASGAFREAGDDLDHIGIVALGLVRDLAGHRADIDRRVVQ